MKYGHFQKEFAMNFLVIEKVTIQVSGLFCDVQGVSDKGRKLAFGLKIQG